MEGNRRKSNIATTANRPDTPFPGNDRNHVRQAETTRQAGPQTQGGTVPPTRTERVTAGGQPLATDGALWLGQRRLAWRTKVGQAGDQQTPHDQ